MRKIEPQGVQISVKVRVGSPPDELSRAPGTIKVTQVFPDEVDDDLVSIYIVDVDPTWTYLALKFLRANANVEYAEIAALRGLC